MYFDRLYNAHTRTIIITAFTNDIRLSEVITKKLTVRSSNDNPEKPRAGEKKHAALDAYMWFSIVDIKNDAHNCLIFIGPSISRQSA